MEPHCLIEHRFEIVRDGKRVSIFDLTAEEAAGKRSPLHVIVDDISSDKQACMVALEWLYEEAHISRLEYLHAADQIHLKYRDRQ